MVVECLYNTGAILLHYDKKPLGVSAETEYGELDIGKKYLVMGIIMKSGYLTYLIDDFGTISACPSYLFRVIDNTIPTNWYFKNYTKEDFDYINKEAIWGYYELVFDDNHYEKLIEYNEEAHRIYFRRKIELENHCSICP